MFPPCGLTSGQSVVEVMEITVPSFKWSLVLTAALNAPTLQQATADTRLCWRLLDTHGQVWVSLLWGHCSFLLGPGAHSFVCALQESVSSVLCKFWRLYGGVNGNHLPRGLMPYPGLLYPKPLPLRQSTADLYLCRRHSNSSVSVSVGSLGPGCTRFV